MSVKIEEENSFIHSVPSLAFNRSVVEHIDCIHAEKYKETLFYSLFFYKFLSKREK